MIWKYIRCLDIRYLICATLAEKYWGNRMMEYTWNYPYLSEPLMYMNKCILGEMNRILHMNYLYRSTYLPIIFLYVFSLFIYIYESFTIPLANCIFFQSIILWNYILVKVFSTTIPHKRCLLFLLSGGRKSKVDSHTWISYSLWLQRLAYCWYLFQVHPRCTSPRCRSEQ